jgi:beta-glucosidase
VERPTKKLIGFSRVTVPAGQTRRVSISVRGRDIAYWDVARHAWALERATLEILAGNASADAALTLKTSVSIAP